jgi:hypothetical protein
VVYLVDISTTRAILAVKPQSIFRAEICKALNRPTINASMVPNKCPRPALVHHHASDADTPLRHAAETDVIGETPIHLQITSVR